MERAVELELLLEHADWVRGLAHRLVSDPASADDAAQDAWLAAVKRPPRAGVSPRAWLGRVLHNSVLRAARDRRLELERQERAASAEALPSASELAEQAELQRRLAGMVLELDEPYRQTLLLRFYRGLSAEDIAQRSNVPLNTVRTRVQRGLAQLREALDRRCGDRSTWMAMFAPIARDAVPAGAGSLGPLLGAGVMAMQWKWAAVLATATLGAAWWWGVTRGDVELAGSAGTTDLSTPAEVARPTDAPRGAPLDAPPTPERAARTTSIDASAQNSAPEVAKPRTETRVSGRCVDLRGLSMPGLQLAWAGQEPGAPVAVTDAEGRFELRYDGPAGRFERFEVITPGLALVDRVPMATDSPAGGSLAVWIVAPTVVFEGQIVDRDRRGLPDGRLSWSVDFESRREFAWIGLGAPRLTRLVGTDSDGRFRVDALPLVPGAQLLATARGYGEVRVELPRANEFDRLIPLDVLADHSERGIRGRVVHFDGRGAADAEVFFGQDNTQTDSEGRFELSIDADVSPEEPLTAVLAGSRPAVIDRFGQRLLDSVSGTETIEVVLEAPLPPIAGRVLDVAGEPLADWHVDLADPVPAGTRGVGLESLAGPWPAEATTDGEGRFSIHGLTDRAYRVRAWSPRTLEAIESEPVRPGATDVTLRLPPDGRIERLAGRVLSRGGLPLEGAQILIGRSLMNVGSAQRWLTQPAAVSDANGRFVLRDLPRKGITIGVGDARVRPKMQPFEPVEGAGEYLLEVDLALRFVLEPEDPDAFDRFEVRDRAGSALVVQVRLPQADSTVESVGRVAGAFPVCTVDERAETLILLREGREVGRRTLQLVAGQVNKLR